MDADLCEQLEWDTDFFGLLIAKVRSNSLTTEQADLVDAWCLAHAVRCLYFLARIDDVTTICLAHDYDYQIVDIRMQLACQLSSAPATSLRNDTNSFSVRMAKPADLETLQSIARQSYHDTRFYYDLNFSRDRCDALYETWIKLSCEGYADQVLVAQSGDEIAGYISCHLDKETGTGKIGLVGVSPQMRSRGVGNSLLLRALEWFRDVGASEVTVVTQARNTVAQRIYQRVGFLTESVHMWYHKWFV